MKVIQKNKKIPIIVLIAVMVILLSIFAWLSLYDGIAAHAYATLPSSKIANVYDGTKFDFTRLNSLAVKAGYANFEAMVSGAESGTIKKANQFGTDTVVDFGSYTFGGTTRDLTWIPSYLSKDTSGNAVLTLWLATNANANGTVSYQEISTYSDGTHQYTFGSGYTKSYTDPHGGTASVYSHTYDGSYIRNVMLCGRGSTSYTKAWGYRWDESQSKAVTISGSPATIPTNLTKFTQLSSGSLSSYLIAPKNISWITSQSAKNDSSYSGTGNHAKAYYPTKWQSDLLWLPSEYEIKASGLWNISTDQRKSVANYWTPTRTATSEYSSETVFFDNSGNRTPHAVSRTYSVRPAINLNLSKILQDFTLKNPDDLTYDYDYNVSGYTLDTLAVKPGWYDAAKYGNSSKVQVTYPAGVIKNAGTYYVKVEIKAPELTFRGTPDTSDPGHVESATVRWFKFIIKPKELTVNKPSYNATTGTLSPPGFANASELYADAPAVVANVTGTAGDGTVVNLIDAVPTKRGTYKAQAMLVKSTTDNTPYDGGNYVIKNETNMYCDIIIDFLKLDIPTASEGSKTYTGSDIRFVLDGYTEAWREIATIVVPDNLKLVEDSGAWYIVAKDAGTYSVTAAIKPEKKSDWCWKTTSPTEGMYDDKAISVTINRKTLYIDFTSSNGAFLMQQGMNVQFSAEPSNAVDGDEVKISLQYCNVLDDSIKIPVPGGILDASTIEEAGTYRIYASLDDSAAEANKNYVLDASGSYQDFSISAQNINIESLSWEYRENGGAATPIAEGSGASDSSPFALEYTGGTFTFALGLNAAGLASRGVKVATAFGVNGYTNATQINFTENAVAVTVRVIPVNEGYAFNGPNGKPRDEQYEDFTLYVKIDKANIDFSKVKWSADALEYNPLGNKVEVASGIPSFLNITYNDGASGVAVGDYKAEVRSLVVKNNAADIATSLNYNIPTLTEVRANENLKHDWKITKKKINVTWIPKEESGENGIVWIPYIIDNSFDVIEYTYYLDSDEDMENPMTLDDIMDAYDETKFVDYVVCATVNNSNFVLVENGNETEFSLSAFQVGNNKIPVRVNLKTDKVVYNGTKQLAVVEVDSGGVKINVTTTYYVKDSGGEFTVLLTDPDQPTDAGEYEIRVALTPDVSEAMAISGQRKFLYTIEKADIDLSAMKWVDTENDNAEYTGPYTYVYDGSHTLAFSGDSLELIDGLKMEYSTESGYTATATDAGTYKVKVTFSVNDADLFDESNYNVPKDIEFEWEILQYTPDLSGVKWNYNADPFVFKIIGGTPVKHSARLIGFPEEYADELASMITYSDEDPGAFSDVGIHTTSFTVNETHEKRGNYGTFVFPAGLESSITWEIHPLKVEKAEQRQTKPFCAEGYGLDEITNLPEDFYEYFDVQVLDDASREVPKVGDTWNFKDIGRYRIKITFKNGMNKNSGGLFDNVKWADNSRSAYQIILTLEKLVLSATGWTDGTELEKPTLNTEELEDIEKYFDYVLKKQGSDELIAMDATLDYDTAYQISLKLKDEFAGNVTINYNGDEVVETKPYTFITGADPLADLPVNFYDIPEELRIEYRYTGSEITFEFGDWYDSDVMQVIGAMKGTEVGEYPVMISFVSGSLAAWGTEDKYVSVITVTFVIIEDDLYGRFVLTEAAAAKDAFKFQREDFSFLEGDIKDYVYSTDNVVYMTKLTCEDTLDDLLKQFKNEDIKVFGEDGKQIETMTQPLCTGMILRLVDGETVLNQLTISVLGDVDGDGDITTVDKAQLNAYSLGTMDLTGAKLLAGDIDNDGDITTVDKAQLNAYTLGSFDIYENLVLKTATAQVLSVQVEESEEAVEEKVITLSETVEIEIVKSEELKVNSEEVPEREEAPAESVVLVDTKRLRVSF